MPVTTFRIVAPINLRPMAATGILLGDVVIALAFVVVAAAVMASTFVGGGRSSRHCSVARRELGLINCANTKGEFCW